MLTGTISVRRYGMKKQNPAVPTVVCVIVALLLAACFHPVGTTRQDVGANTGRVLITIAGEGELAGTEPAASVSRTLLPEYGVLTYTLTIAKEGTTVFTQTLTETSAATDLEAGTYTVSVSAKNSGTVLVAEGNGTVAISPGVESPVTIRLASVVSGTGTFAYTVSLTLPGYAPFKSGSINFFSLSGGTDPSPVDLTGGLTGTESMPAGFYRVVLAVEILGKRVAKTQIVHISDQTTTTAEFDLAIGDFIPVPPEGGSVFYITDQGEMAAIGDHIGSEAMNYGKNAYVLLNDIALAGDWIPIGSRSGGFGPDQESDWQYAFQGHFFGENHRITGLKFPDATSYHSDDFSYTGLFGVIHKALVQDLTVETGATRITLNNTASSGDKYHFIGFVAGRVNESDLSNITVKPGNISVEKPEGVAVYQLIFGGVAGHVNNSRLREIVVTGMPGSSLSFPLNSNSPNINIDIGGIAGMLAGSSEISGSAVSLNNNVSLTNVGSILHTGGLAGSHYGTIRQSSYSGTVAISHTGQNFWAYTGGIAGTSESGGTIDACYAAPLITINSANTYPNLYTGGLVGSIDAGGTVRNSYAACGIEINTTITVDMFKYVYSGGVAGGYYNENGAVENCYAAGSLQVVINGTPQASDRIQTGGISGSSSSVSSSAALLNAIAGSAGTHSRIVPVGTRSNNIAFNNMFINGVTLLDAVSVPLNDINGLGKTAAQLASQPTYAGLGWDFAGVWKMGSAEYPYPLLQWQEGAPPVPPGFELLKDEKFEAEFYLSLEEPLNLAATTLIIYKINNPKTLTLTAPTGYDSYQWLVDGRTAAGSPGSLVIGAANHAVGDHAVTAIMWRDGVPYSKNIVITVSGE
jgi:hypothetical protein